MWCGLAQVLGLITFTVFFLGAYCLGVKHPFVLLGWGAVGVATYWCVLWLIARDKP